MYTQKIFFISWILEYYISTEIVFSIILQSVMHKAIYHLT